jgi:hypothetical protein
MKDWKPIIVDETPITETTFQTQGWEKHIEEEDEYSYWTLPLPKDNPDGDTICLISSADIDAEDLGLAEGAFIVSIYDYNGLGVCNCEEEIEILYRALTGDDIYDDEN